MPICSKCSKEHTRVAQRYCLPCHNEYMREWRKRTVLTEEQKVKDRARSYANVYLKRGHLTKKPCGKCGNNDSQMHHPDYSKPLEVIWLCRKCHLAEHTVNK